MFETFGHWLAFDLLKMDPATRFSGSFAFFISDVFKITVLLLVIIFISSLLRSYLSRERIRSLLANRFEFLGNILAALIGIVTPFCSCSAVPLFIGFVESGVPLGVTFSYLISAPMVNEVAAVMLFALFGWKIAGIYILSGVTLAIVTGVIMGKMNIRHLVVENASEEKIKEIFAPVGQRKFSIRIKNAWNYTWALVKNIYIYVLIGVALGAGIHGYAPENLLGSIAGKNNPLAVPVAVLIGVPLYSNAAGMVPIVRSLVEKGLPIGTTLAFMMAVTALSLPEIIILRKVLKPKLLAIYIAILTIGIIFTGYLFNWMM